MARAVIRLVPRSTSDRIRRRLAHRGAARLGLVRRDLHRRHRRAVRAHAEAVQALHRSGVVDQFAAASQLAYNEAFRVLEQALLPVPVDRGRLVGR